MVASKRQVLVQLNCKTKVSTTSRSNTSNSIIVSGILGNNLIIWRQTLLQERCVKSLNKDGSHAKNVDVKLNAKA